MTDVFETALNLKQCADELGRVSAKLLEFRLNHWETLSQAENIALEAQERELDIKANQLLAQAIVVIGEGATQAQQEIVEATTKAAAFIQKIDDAARAIAVAASVITLGVTIATGDPKTIIAAAAAVTKAAKKPN
jgi:hypothetical protein